MSVRRNWKTIHDTSKWALLVVIPLVLMVHLVAQTLAADTVESRKMKRQIAIMEQVLDQVLLESPNFLVSGGKNTRGVYISEFGALFTFEASLIQKDWDMKSFSRGFKYEVDDEGNKVIIWEDPDHKKPGHEDDEEMEDEDPDADADADADAHEERSRAKARAKRLQEKLGNQEDLYERGKKEILDVLLEYGDTITSLNDNQWVAVVGFLKDSNFFVKNKLSRVVMKAQMRDLRAYTAGQLSEQSMIAKVVQEEY